MRNRLTNNIKIKQKEFYDMKETDLYFARCPIVDKKYMLMENDYYLRSNFEALLVDKNYELIITDMSDDIKRPSIKYTLTIRDTYFDGIINGRKQFVLYPRSNVDRLLNDIRLFINKCR